MVSTTHVFVFIVFVLVVIALYMLVRQKGGFKMFMGGGPTRLILSEPEYTHILDGKKKYDVRPLKKPFDHIKVGDEILIVRSRPKGDTTEHPRYKVSAKILSIDKFDTIEKALKSHIDKIYPGKKVSEGVDRYKEFNKGDEEVILIGFEIMEAKKKSAKRTEHLENTMMEDYSNEYRDYGF